MKKGIYILFIAILFFFSLNTTSVVYADSLESSINDQLNNLDLTQFENFFNNIQSLPEGTSFLSYVNGLLDGKYDIKFENIFTYLFNALFSSVSSFLPTFASVVIITLLCNLLHKNKGEFASESVGEIIVFVCLLSIILLLTSQLILIWQNAKNIIENIAKLTEIMSPIILTLMIASGGNVSASVYKPAVAFLSNGVVSIFLYLIMPLVALMIVFYVISSFSSTAKLDKFIEVSSSIIKWIIGLVVAIFTIFMSVQGITSATFDGISLKATKYLFSNSIPLVGGFVSSSFDLVIAGSILIKNVLGITGVLALFYIILSPLLQIVAFSWLLKLMSGVIQPIADTKITSFCDGISKCVTYISATLISVGFMLFITILLITFSANAFI